MILCQTFYTRFHHVVVQRPMQVVGYTGLSAIRALTRADVHEENIVHPCYMDNNLSRWSDGARGLTAETWRRVIGRTARQLRGLTPGSLPARDCGAEVAGPERVRARRGCRAVMGLYSRQGYATSALLWSVKSSRGWQRRDTIDRRSRVLGSGPA